MPAIFDFAGKDADDSKMLVSRGSLPPYIDASQPPTKRSPWRQIKELPFVHTFTILMPEEMDWVVWDKLDDEVKSVKYAKVIMKLQEVLEGDFFTEYIKKGTSVMFLDHLTCFVVHARRCCCCTRLAPAFCCIVAPSH
jgi:ribonuclease P/MRP protein subunit RPP40